MAAFMGMRGTGDWVSNQMPENWREVILRLFPNGSAPLTAIMSKMKSESTDSPIFHWWDKELPTQRATITGVYTDVLSTPYTTGGALGDTLYVKFGTAAEAREFKLSDVVLLRDASDYTVDVNARVSAAPVENGASSYITVVLLEADNNSTSHDLSDADTAMVIGTMNEEGTTAPTAKAYDPTEYYNYTQIFRNSLDMTRTAMKTKLRTGDAYAEAKRDCLELHSIEMEKAFLWGIRTTGTGTAGKPRRTTNGVIRQITTNVSDYYSNSTYSGQTWLQGGELWLDTMLEQVFRYGSSEKMAFAGSGAVLGLNRLAKASGQITMTPMTAAYGLKVMQWITPFGTMYLKTHPLFSYEATNRNSMLVFEPANLIYRYLDDTKFKADIQANDVDGKKDEYLTEAGLELHFEKAFGWLNGVGLDNAV